jgi:hypothetical protein
MGLLLQINRIRLFLYFKKRIVLYVAMRHKGVFWINPQCYFFDSIVRHPKKCDGADLLLYCPVLEINKFKITG